MIYVLYQISHSRDREKTDKIESMTKKMTSEFWAVKWKFVS